jgi:mono/diheme cytochrome c family protein
MRRLAVLALAVAFAGACRQDMHDQPKMKPLRGSRMFADGRSARPFVVGTVARGTLREDQAFFAGRTEAGFVTEVPVKVTPELLQRGRERFEIFCAPCHGRTGGGDGMVVQRGFKTPPSYHTDRLRGLPVGYLYDVATRGFGAMSGYAAQVPPADRWAIVAYIRVLQYSQHASVADVPVAGRIQLERSVGDAARPEEGRPAAGSGEGRPR